MKAFQAKFEHKHEEVKLPSSPPSSTIKEGDTSHLPSHLKLFETQNNNTSQKPTVEKD
jgi:hypothetical protein